MHETLWGDLRGPLFSLRVIADPRMVVSVPRSDFSRTERVRMWFERLVDGAELTREVFPWPRVARSVIRHSTEVLKVGQTLYCHPAVADRLRREGGPRVSRAHTRPAVPTLPGANWRASLAAAHVGR